ncbi:unnamed protein product [Cuscuta epithymum]|uniref:Uncharacterized protein n=1 Tax=Cuscuta epithymum TaxID=186058 RepID=A0AAV0FWB2_9ASTE|nr:unnamed protein product [Cuscuta epithymum]
MVLRVTLANPGNLREATEAVTPAELTRHVIMIWTPEYLAFQSTITERMLVSAENGCGDNNTALLKIDPAASPAVFSSYHSTDAYFNAVVERVDLQAVLFTAQSSDTIEFSQSLEVDNLINGFGYLRARFDRPVGAYNEDYISMKIYGIVPEKMLKTADISKDPAVVPLPPLATLDALTFKKSLGLMRAVSRSVEISVKKGEVYISPVDVKSKPLILNREYGLISTREDIRKNDPAVNFKINLLYLDLQLAGLNSAEVSVYKRPKDVVLLWYQLDDTKGWLLKGDIFYYLY